MNVTIIAPTGLLPTSDFIVIHIIVQELGLKVIPHPLYSPDFVPPEQPSRNLLQ